MEKEPPKRKREAQEKNNRNFKKKKSNNFNTCTEKDKDRLSCWFQAAVPQMPTNIVELFIEKILFNVCYM